MRFSVYRNAGAALCAALLVSHAGSAGCAKAPEKPAATAAPPAEFTHRASGFRFPLHLEGFQRTEFHSFDAGETNVSIGYDADDLAATVYIYPIGKDETLATMAEQVTRDVAVAHKSVKVLEDGPIVIRPAGKEQKGVRRVYDIELKPDAARREKDIFPDGHRPSYMYLFTSGPWFVKLRASPMGKPEDIEERLRELLEGILWP